MRGLRLRAGWPVVPLVVLALAACDEPAAPAAPFADCAALSQPPQDAPAPEDAPAGGAAPAPLPAVTLPCYTGGAQVEVAGLRGPAVVNLWASWCAPCREELPVLQRYADRVAGRAYVVGVVTEDTRTASTALAEDLALRFPNLYDQSAQLRRGLNRAALPITLFVDAAGRVRLLYNEKALDERTLARLADEHLGVRP